MASPTLANEPLTTCPSCAAACPVGARFCPNCGGAIDITQPPQTAGQRVTGSMAADPLIGQVIAERYRIMEILGRGGMGVVYRVEHVHIGKLMAIKLLSGELANDPQTLKRFQREAKVISKLSHPNTVQIFDFGESAKLAYLVMEYLPGRSLASLIASERALPVARVALIGAQIAGSVEEAHRAGVIHRDIKPENVMVLDTSEQHDFVKVLDFGIAKLRDSDDSLHTQKGHLIGTPYYMAPEQIRGEAYDHRVDIYALGALMYQAVTGQLPFVGVTPMEILGQHLNAALIPTRQRAPELAIPQQIAAIIEKAMAKDPARRYQSMAALRDELSRFLRSLGIGSGAFELEPEHVLGLGSAGKVATRGDIDGYEKEVVRASRLGKVVGTLALIGVLAAGYALLRVDLSHAPRDVESEPNDEPLSANLLSPALPIRALLGKRKSPSEGDADVFRVELANEAARVADITVSSLPNIDLALDLVQKGSAQPILSVDTGKVGASERIPNFTLAGETYYLRVREAKAAGGLPVENVSDAYVISIKLAFEDTRNETEPNDGYELATTLKPFAPLHGLIGWADDRDVYCAEPSAGKQTVVVSGVPELDLVLAYLDRGTDSGQRIDHKGRGEEERIELPATSSARRACFTVSARAHDDARSAAPGSPYQIALSLH